MLLKILPLVCEDWIKMFFWLVRIPGGKKAVKLQDKLIRKSIQEKNLELEHTSLYIEGPQHKD